MPSHVSPLTDGRARRKRWCRRLEEPVAPGEIRAVGRSRRPQPYRLKPWRARPNGCHAHVRNTRHGGSRQKAKVAKIADDPEYVSRRQVAVAQLVTDADGDFHQLSREQDMAMPSGPTARPPQSRSSRATIERLARNRTFGWFCGSHVTVVAMGCSNSQNPEPRERYNGDLPRTDPGVHQVPRSIRR